jgi:hypothetical protein
MEYDAFISYRRSDGRRVAEWLRRELENFRPPKKLAHVAVKKLRIYLDTAYERGTDDFYENSIRPALLASRYLVVVATPDALVRAPGKTDWMQRERTDFANCPNARNVLAVRGAGEFPGTLPADLAESFPNIEIVDLRGAGRLSFLNPLRATRLAAEKLKLLAPLLDVRLEDVPALRQEEEQRQQARLGATAGLGFAVFALVAGASVFAFRSLWTAQEALKSSIFTTEHMIAAISDRMPVEDNPYGIRGALLNQACDLLAKLALESRSGPSVRERVLCELERARGHETQKELALADAAFVRAVVIARTEHKRTQSPGAATALAEASVNLVDYLLRINEHARAQAAIEDLLRDAQTLTEQHPDDPYFLTTQADAYERRASLIQGVTDPAARLMALDQAVLSLSKAQAHSRTSPAMLPGLLTRQAALLADAAQTAATLKDFTKTLNYLHEAIKVRDGIDWSRVDQPTDAISNGMSIAELSIGIAAVEASLGHRRQAREAESQAEKRLAEIGNHPNLPAGLVVRSQSARQLLGEIDRMLDGDARARSIEARP